LLSTLADQTAVALENARLFDDLKARNVEIEHLNQELTVANRELTRLDRAKSDFLNIASHELRTPLTHIRGYNDILGEMAEGGSLAAASGLPMIQGVKNGVARLQEIVDVMFDVSKIDTETLDLHLFPVSPAPIVEEAVEMWVEALEERKLALTVEGLEGLPTIIADNKRLEQAFSHLLQNAIKFTPDGGEIKISGRLLGEELPLREQFIEVVIADTGIGIAPDDLERIFEKFYRVGDVALHSTGRAKFKGAGPGLGLTVARGVVKAHGGRIWAESPGYDEETCPGTKFYVVLPVKPPDVEARGLDALIPSARTDANHA
jgi:signal transduction histidine kinase